MNINYYHLPKASIILLIVWLFPYGSMWTVTLSKTLLMTNELGFTEHDTTRILHIVTAVKYILAIICAIVADTSWGKYKTLVFIILLTTVLCQPLAMLSVMPKVSREIRKIAFLTSTVFEMFVRTYAVLYLPFVSEQFIMPDEEEPLRKFYFVYFMACNVLNVVFIFIGPMFIHLISCFGKPCYLIPWTYDLICTIIFLTVMITCKKYFRIITPTRSVVVEAVGCISHAIRVKSKTREKKKHFIDHAEDKYDEDMRNDVKRLFKVAVFYIPIIGYYSLYWQMMTKWVFQASNMDGDFKYFRILPAQTIALNPFLILIFVPLLETLVFPWLSKHRILYTSLQRLGFAWCLLITSFLCAGIVQLEIEKRIYYPANHHHCQVTVFNPSKDDLYIRSSKINGNIPPRSLGVYNNVKVDESNATLILTRGFIKKKKSIEIEELSSLTFIYEDDLRKVKGKNDLRKWPGSRPTLNVVSLEATNLIFTDPTKSTNVHFKKNERDVVRVSSGMLKLYKESDLIHSKKLAPGGVYLMVIWKDGGELQADSFILIDPPSVHIAWMLPQFIFQSLAEAFQYISLMLFVYTQAPPSLRSIVMSFLLISQACGNFVIAAISSIPNIEHSTETFISTCFHFLCLMLFIFLAKRYTYQKITD